MGPICCMVRNVDPDARAGRRAGRSLLAPVAWPWRGGRQATSAHV